MTSELGTRVTGESHGQRYPPQRTDTSGRHTERQNMGDLEYVATQAVRQYVVRGLTLITDNTQYWQERLIDAAGRAVAEGMGSTVPTLDDYTAALAGRSAMWSLDEYADSAGVYVIDELRDLIDEELEGDSVSKSILIDLLDLNDSTQRRMLGAHYLPETTDDAAKYLTNDSDESGED